jgi:uracil-DNA glycosylase family 4
VSALQEGHAGGVRRRTSGQRAPARRGAALLDRALAEAGVDRGDVYVTNAVKHFKFEPRGKRRIHQTPDRAEVEACRPWLFRELELVGPRLVVCMGATASRAFFGPGFRLMRSRGRVLESPLAPRVLATIHPSAALRAPDDAGRRKMFASLVRDLRAAARASA